MSEKVLISRSTMESIGDAIRYASGGTAQYLPGQMPAAIRALGEGGSVNSNIIAPFFDQSAQYYTGDLVVYNETLYKFTAPHLGLWNGTDAVVTSVSKELSEKQDELTFDAEPTEGSTNPVESGGIKNYVDGTVPYAVPVTLTAGGWTGNAQTVTVSGISADESAQLIQPVPYLSSRAAYNAAGIEATAQGANSLTFTCTTVPSVSLSVYVVITPLAG